MLRAAYGLFRANGYAGTTMQAIADEAGVAVQTIYFTFHTKAALLDEVTGAAIVGFDLWLPPPGGMQQGLDLTDPKVLRQYHDWYPALETAESSRVGLELFLAAGVNIMERTAPLVPIMREAAVDPAAKSLYEIGETRRASSYEAVVRVLSKREGGLRKGLGVRRATDILLTVFSGETYQMLRERGWKPREIQKWLLDVLCHQLLAP